MDLKNISKAVESLKESIKQSFNKFNDDLRQECIDSLTASQERKLQDYFITNEREYNGIPVTKENCEDLFENWLGGLTLVEINKILYA